MQEIKKPSIVLASILKPVDDTRMLEKLGNTLTINGYDVHIIGYGDPILETNITTHALGKFERISFTRLIAPLKVLGKVFSIKPGILIINTHELLFIALLYKTFTGSKIIYDVLENYYLNILNTQAFPPSIKVLIALWVRLKEGITKPFMTHYILAEKIYETELRFVQQNFTVIENKCNVPGWYKKKSSHEKLRLLFTGTIDTSTGILEIIRLVKVLYSVNNAVELRIVGYCALSSLRTKIMHEIAGCEFISFKGLNALVHHQDIFKEISEATAGLVYYPAAKHNRHRIPTKIYEYLACKLPIIYDETSSFAQMIEPLQAGIAINFQNPDVAQIMSALNLNHFYTNPVQFANWNTEESKLLNIIKIL